MDSVSARIDARHGVGRYPMGAIPPALMVSVCELDWFGSVVDASRILGAFCNACSKILFVGQLRASDT